MALAMREGFGSCDPAGVVELLTEKRARMGRITVPDRVIFYRGALIIAKQVQITHRRRSGYPKVYAKISCVGQFGPAFRRPYNLEEIPLILRQHEIMEILTATRLSL